MEPKDAKNKAKSAIVLVQCLLKHFYGDESSLYVQYIRRGCRKFGNAMERIRIDLLQENRKKGNHKDKKLEVILELYRKIYYERQFGLSFVERENQTLLAITKNPDKKPVPEKKNKPIMFHGQDLSKFDTVAERQNHRTKMREEQIKTNWHTIERVNKKQEPRITLYQK